MIDTKVLRLLPLVVMLLLALGLATGVFTPKNAAVNKSLMGAHIAPFDVPVLGSSTARFSPAVWQGKVVLLNIFASWCKPCAIEHSLLMKLAQSGKVQLYGLAWKDAPQDVTQWLAANGNPYQVVGIDQYGQSTIPLELTGAPETFVIGKNGNVAYRYAGALTDEIINRDLLPLVEKLGAAK